MTEFVINYWAVLTAAVANMVIGSLWYSQVLFGKTWMKLSGLTQEKMAEAKKKGIAKSYVWAFVGSLVMAYVLAQFLALGGVFGVGDALTLVFWLWLGFVVTIKLGDVLWAGDSVKLYLINIAHYLVSMWVMAIILTVWS